VSHRFWRGPDDMRRVDAPESPEFPDGADERPEVSRRGLLRLLGASAALGGAAACSRGRQEYIVPYVNQPPEVTPSVPTLYATTMTLDGYGVGMIVRSSEGRPTKAEGNPLHPASLGALGAVHQASILDFYDPTRSRAIVHDGAPATWSAFGAFLATAAPPGKQTHVVLPPTSGPHLVERVQRLRQRGDVVVHFDSPLARANAWAGARFAFGRVLETRWALDRAEVVVALDADFLGDATTPLAWARGWAQRRSVNAPQDAMGRLYAVGPRLTVTAMAADDRLRVPGRAVGQLAADLLAEVLSQGLPDVPADLRRAASARPRGPHADFVRAVARDLRAHLGASVVVVSDSQPPQVHAVAHAINELLGNARRTVSYGPSPVFEAGEASHGLDALVRALDAGDVSTLVIAGGDCAYTAPADLDLARRIRAVHRTVFVGAHENATARACSWHLPEAHFLEAWSDARAFDGTPSVVQPLMRPLAPAVTTGQVLAALLGQADATPLDLVQSTWRSLGKGTFEAFWQAALVRGAVEGGAFPTVDARVDWIAVARALPEPAVSPLPYELAYFADAKVVDGRFADSPWLQELPDPVTKLAWDNAALMSPATASGLGVESSDVVELAVRGRRLEAPALVVPSMADGVVALALGYGQNVPELASHGAGANAYALRDSRALWFDDVRVRKLDATWPLALVQEHWTMEGRPIVLRRTLEEYRADPAFAARLDAAQETLYLLAPDARRQWGMTIDLNACTGCSACVVACMAENNVPVVGKAGVRLGREMHWLRIDRYFEGDPRDATAVVQPMLCQHCEKAPCEYVCPVNATVHSHDGLNEMIYNRCVGTRFCSNNCPYKVRRFNFFEYNRGKPESLQLAMNPDVTVRQRGVMEKCTYCVQRIREVEIRAGREHRTIRDLEIQTACQQTCPTGAIVFGDIADRTTAVSRSRDNPRLYQVLHELGTLPRTRYLARIVNPNPELARS
jgi:molybdopterin-containing oxidoreductase family iron-sulfur binding subunit